MTTRNAAPLERHALLLTGTQPAERANRQGNVERKTRVTTVAVAGEHVAK